jgi:hypothetical protein
MLPCVCSLSAKALFQIQKNKNQKKINRKSRQPAGKKEKVL